jgi:hypothetical protein
LNLVYNYDLTAQIRPQNPKEPHPQQQRNPSCFDFVNQLVQKVFDASWYVARGDVGNGMMLTSEENPYEKYMPGGMNDSNGFKETLTQYGQAGDVYRHILFFKRLKQKSRPLRLPTQFQDTICGRHVGRLSG